MSKSDEPMLQAQIANAMRRQRTGERWAVFVAHLGLAILLTLITWAFILTGNEPISTGAILLTVLAFLGCLLHLRSALADSGMVQQSAADVLAREIVRRGIDVDTLLASLPEKRKRESVVGINEDGEMVTDSALDEDDNQPHQQAPRTTVSRRSMLS